MKFSTVFFVFLIFATAVSATAQRKTVTNADLEKYRQARLDAERDYRENHVRLGLPSPEELARRNEASRKELSELSARLRSDEIQREQIRFQPKIDQAPVVNLNFGTQGRGAVGIAPAVIWDYYRFESDDWRRHGYRKPFVQQYYISGGSIWPIGPRTASQPLIKVKSR
jgi:hypothetical protein